MAVGLVDYTINEKLRRSCGRVIDCDFGERGIGKSETRLDILPFQRFLREFVRRDSVGNDVSAS